MEYMVNDQKIRVLFVGESWHTKLTEGKGFDFFSVGFYEEAANWLFEALKSDSIELTYLPSHEVATKFPKKLEDLKYFDVLLLSDIGSDTFLLSPETFLHSKRSINLLELIEKFVREGGGVCMIGGYLSFQGIGGKARYHRSPIETLLPVSLLPYDDREEVPEGFIPEVCDKDHSIMKGIDDDWPYLLGYNRLILKEEGTLVLKRKEDPILAVGAHGKGRTMAFASDCSPHWAPLTFCKWLGYQKLWQQSIQWLAYKEQG